MKQSLLYRSDIKRRTPFHCDKNTTVNMITLATKKKCNQNLILYPERYTVILFKCRRLKTVKLGVSSRGEIVFFFILGYIARVNGRDSKSLSPSRKWTPISRVVKRPMIAHDRWFSPCYQVSYASSNGKTAIHYHEEFEQAQREW